MTLKLKFPLCAECHRVSQTPWYARLIMILGALAILGLVFWGVVTYSYIGLLIGAGLGLLLFLLLAWIANVISQRGMTAEQRARRKAVRRAVRIAGFRTPGIFGKGWVSFKFENASFANEFCQMNLGEIV